MTSLEYFRHNLDRYLGELKLLTAIETPTGDLDQLDRAADFLAGRLAPLGELERSMIPDHGPLLRLVRKGSGVRVLLLGHYDTVWSVGSWPSLWKVENGRAYAPGIYDMKAGLLFILWMLRYLDAKGLAHPNFEVMLNPDEELGSPGTRPFIEEAARRADVVLVLEPSNLEGSLKLARKGSGEYVVTIHGRSAHQGVEPEMGVNAVIEAAHQVLRVMELEDLDAGTTVGPNVIHGGEMANMVPSRAEIRVDVRAWTREETQRLDSALRGLQPVMDDVQIHVFGGWARPPMEISDASREIFQGARVIGQGLGLDIDWVRWGGSSDANLASAVGAPTLDGFGPIGEGSHQPDECIVVDELATRMALFTEVARSFVHVE